MAQYINNLFPVNDFSDRNFVEKLIYLNELYQWGLVISPTDTLTTALTALGGLSSPDLLTQILAKLREIGLPLPEDANVVDILNLLHIERTFVADIDNASLERDWDLAIDDESTWEATVLELRTLVRDRTTELIAKLNAIGGDIAADGTLQDIFNMGAINHPYISTIIAKNTEHKWGLNITLDMTWEEVLLELRNISITPTMSYLGQIGDLIITDSIVHYSQEGQMLGVFLPTDGTLFDAETHPLLYAYLGTNVLPVIASEIGSPHPYKIIADYKTYNDDDDEPVVIPPPETEDPYAAGVQIGELIISPKTVWTDENGVNCFSLLESLDNTTFDLALYPLLAEVYPNGVLPYMEQEEGSPFPYKVVADLIDDDVIDEPVVIPPEIEDPYITGVQIGELIISPETVWTDENGVPIYTLLESLENTTFDLELYPLLAAVHPNGILPYMEQEEDSPFPYKVVADYTGAEV